MEKFKLKSANAEARKKPGSLSVKPVFDVGVITKKGQPK
jgi:hypothetical protein